MTDVFQVMIAEMAYRSTNLSDIPLNALAENGT
jgi:hypothetical protein